MKIPHLNAVELNNLDLTKRLPEGEDKAFQAEKSIGKHLHQNEKKGKQQQYEYHSQHHNNARSGRQTPRGYSYRQRQQRSASKSRADGPRTIRGYDFRTTDDITNNADSKSVSPDRVKSKKGGKKVGYHHEMNASN